jgi:hypothetical protein
VLGAQGGLAIASQCVLRGGPVVRSTLPSSVTSFECWWPAARGNPASVGRARQSSQRDPHRRRPAKAACVWCRREEMPRRRPSHPLRCPATRKGNMRFPHCVHADSFVGRRFRRFGYERSGREQAPAMGYGYRRGANLRRVEHWWECRPRPSHLRMATAALRKPSEPQVRYRDATGPESTSRRKPSKW